MDKINIKHSNYTTPEQSKRLLELGVPADSADCVAYIVDKSIDLHEYFFPKGDARISVINPIHTYTKVTTLENNEFWLDEPYPCWSVGRLMQIFAICFDPDFIHFDTFADGINFLQQMMGKFETYAKNMDFSKLEE